MHKRININEHSFSYTYTGRLVYTCTNAYTHRCGWFRAYTILFCLFINVLTPLIVLRNFCSIKTASHYTVLTILQLQRPREPYALRQSCHQIPSLCVLEKFSSITHLLLLVIGFPRLNPLWVTTDFLSNGRSSRYCSKRSLQILTS